MFPGYEASPACGGHEDLVVSMVRKRVVERVGGCCWRMRTGWKMRRRRRKSRRGKRRRNERRRKRNRRRKMRTGQRRKGSKEKK